MIPLSVVVHAMCYVCVLACPVKAAILCQITHHTPHTSLLVERKQIDEANQCMGMIRRPWWSEANEAIGQDAGVSPYSFSKDILGFLMTTESQDLDLTSHPKDSACLTVECPCHYSGVLGPTQTTGWAPPPGLSNTSSSSNLVFPGGLPSRDLPGSTQLSFSGQPVLGVIWLLFWKNILWNLK